jgi:CRP/FNR family transcriptional regulator
MGQNLHLRKIELFKEFNKTQLRKLFYAARVVTLSKGQTVFKAGDFDDNIYVIISGALEILKEDQGSGELVVVALLQQSEHFNESAIFFDSPRNVCVRALSDVELFMIEKDNALKLMEEDNDFAAKLLWRISSKLSERLSNTTSRFTESQSQSSDISDHMQLEE